MKDFIEKLVELCDLVPDVVKAILLISAVSIFWILVLV
tara:strand:- start:1496 stop:1609 length:114 start_codon:yes stop_codon:yes gene_type:complete